MIAQPTLQPGETLISTIRHGLTELNRSKRTGGRTDAPLIEEGRRQAEDARRTFAGTPFDVAYASSLTRAIETAKIIAGVEPPQLQIDDLCIERAFGKMEGLTRAQIKEQLPDVIYVPIGHVHYSLNPPDGETFEMVQERARQFLSKLLATHRGRRILIFSHQNFLQQFHGVLRGLSPLQSLEYDILNCELNQFHLAADDTLIVQKTIQLSANANAFPSF
ncbi:MAG: histidine phosphatase family protein [Chloroflexi bacterium]|nr:histidine phosphatase family protein [Chloroflexota bacterium]